MWASLVLIVAAVVLPYVAVLFANAGRERRDTDGTFMTPREIGPGTGAPRGLRRPARRPTAGRSRVSLLGPVPDAVDELICSARGCRADGDVGTALEQPEAAHPDRRKVWLACDDHREHLSQFLDVRGFLRDVVPAATLEPRRRVMSPAVRRAAGLVVVGVVARRRLHVPRALAVEPARLARRRDRRGRGELAPTRSRSTRCCRPRTPR